MPNETVNLIAAIPKWLFSASFTVVVGILFYLLLTGTKLVLDGGIEFKKKTFISAFSERTSVVLGQVEEVQSDGFIVISVIGTRSGEGIGGLEILGGTDQNLGTRLCAATLSGHRSAQFIANQRASCTTPIRAGEFYSVRRTGNLNSSDYTFDMSFVPLK